MEFIRSRNSITLDATDVEVTELMVATLLNKASKQPNCWDAFIRCRREYEHNDVFLDGWFTEETVGRNVLLRKAVSLQERSNETNFVPCRAGRKK